MEKLTRADQLMVDDLARLGLVVTGIHRTEARLLVVTRTARQAPLVAVVKRGPLERDEAFAKLATKASLREERS